VSKAESCRLYLVTPPALDPNAFKDILAAALDAGDVACVQLRLKDVPDKAIRRACEILLPITRARDVAFILNDRPDLAAATGCDGVHVGQEDAPYADARGIVGDDRIVGVTCHNSRDLAMDGAEAGADYVAFGAFFPTATKQAKASADLELLRWWNDIMTVPVVAIGGITAENCGPVVEAGADFLAISAGIWDFPGGPAAGVKAVNEAIRRHSE
jgi:thiamine-phosphate pyrophosphorylase